MRTDEFNRLKDLFVNFLDEHHLQSLKTEEIDDISSLIERLDEAVEIINETNIELTDKVESLTLDVAKLSIENARLNKSLEELTTDFYNLKALFFIKVT